MVEFAATAVYWGDLAYWLNSQYGSGTLAQPPVDIVLAVPVSTQPCSYSILYSPLLVVPDRYVQDACIAFDIIVIRIRRKE